MARFEESIALAPVVEAARRGDTGSFERLVRRFRGPMVSYAEALLRDRGHAEDAVQDALLCAWERLAMLRDPEAFRPWVFAILENVVFSGMRKRRRRRTMPLFEGEAIAEGDPVLLVDDGPVLPGERIPTAPAVTMVRASLSAIPGNYRDALLLHYVEGRSTRDVGAALGISFNNARTRLFRARGALRRELARRGHGAEGGNRPEPAK